MNKILQIVNSIFNLLNEECFKKFKGVKTKITKMELNIGCNTKQMFICLRNSNGLDLLQEKNLHLHDIGE